MAKSLRSKVKRSFRSQKRESGVFAATEAARLNRLSTKLMTVASRKENEVEKAEHQEQLPQDCQDSPGWCWFALFGLLDANDITAEVLDAILVSPPSITSQCLYAWGVAARKAAGGSTKCGDGNLGRPEGQ
jgi:hypothetical protein